MIDLAKIIYSDVKPIIEDFIDEDIYAISFFVYNDNDDVLKPTLSVSYNTIDNYKYEKCEAYDEQEAKWNYAFWCKDIEYEFGYGKTADLVKQWIYENKLKNHTLEKEDEMYDDKMIYIGKGPLLTQKFVDILVSVATKLHSENITQNKDGEKLPIIIHELEYYEAIAEQNERANPEGQADEFIKWIRHY